MIAKVISGIMVVIGALILISVWLSPDSPSTLQTMLTAFVFILAGLWVKGLAV